MAAKQAESPPPRPVRDLLRRLIQAPALLSFIWPALLVAGGYFAWHWWGAEHVAKNYYSVDQAMIKITDPPSFVKSNVVQTVYRDTAMEGLSLLDHQATAKIASAFSMHPWVKRVVSVRKLPGGAVEVHIDYRSPTAMIRVTSDDGFGFLPVDIDGVLLPTDGFSSAETWDYIHIHIPDININVGYGSRINDSRVEAAAQLAAMLNPYREQAKIVSVTAVGDPRQQPVPQLEIRTRDQRVFFWGSPPGREVQGESSAAMKLRLMLDQLDADSVDLRMATRPEN